MRNLRLASLCLAVLALPLLIPVACGSNAGDPDPMPMPGTGGTPGGEGGITATGGDGPLPGTGGSGPSEPDAAEPEVQPSVCMTYPILPLTGPNENAAQPAIVWNGSNYVVVYSGGPPGSAGTSAKIFTAVLDATGARTVPQDVLLADTPALATSPELVAAPVAAGAPPTFAVVFEHCLGPSATGCTGGSAVMSARIDAAGAPQGPPVMLAPPAMKVQRRPYIASEHNNVYVTFRDVVPTAVKPDRIAARLIRLDDAGGRVGDGVEVDAMSDGHYPHVAVNSTNVALAYQRNKASSEIVLAIFDPALTLQKEVIVRSGIMGDATNPVVQWNTNRWVIAWEDERNDEARIYATVVDGDGRIGPAGCMGTDCEPDLAYENNGNWPAIASGGAMTSLIGFYGYPGRRVFLARLEASGNLKPGQVVLGVGKFPSVAYNAKDDEYAVVYEDEANHRVVFGRFKCNT